MDGSPHFRETALLPKRVPGGRASLDRPPVSVRRSPAANMRDIAGPQTFCPYPLEPWVVIRFDKSVRFGRGERIALNTLSGDVYRLRASARRRRKRAA